MDSQMEVVDGHMHLWTAETHPALEKFRHGGHPAGKFESVIPYLVKDYQADIAGYNVTQCVYIQAGMPDPVEETMWLDNIATTGNGKPNGIVGFCDLSGANVEEILARHTAASKRFRGIRQLLNYDPDHPKVTEAPHDNYLTDPSWIQGYGLLEKYHVSFDWHILPRQMKRAADVVRQHPNVMCVVDHCGLNYFNDDASKKLWREGLQELARYPNVYCKASGMFAMNTKWSQDSVDMLVKPLMEYFGIDRVMFSSNFPVDKLNGSYSQLIEHLRPILKPFTLEEQKKFFAGTAKKFYRL